MKVYSPQNNHKLNKILMAARVYSARLDVEKVEFDPKVSKPFKESYPQYSLPLLETKDGKFIPGTHSILLHIAGPEGLGDQFARAKTLEELQIIEKTVDPSIGVLVLHQKGCADISESQVEKSRQAILHYLGDINQKLHVKTFLTGDRLSLADISSFNSIAAVYGTFENEIAVRRNLSRWYRYMESLL